MDGVRAPSRSPYLRLPWKRGRIGGHSRKGLLVLGIALFSYLLLFSDSGWFRQWRMSARKTELLQEVQRLELQEARLQKEIWRLEHDPEYRERVAREEWGYRAPGERVYHIRQLN